VTTHTPFSWRRVSLRIAACILGVIACAASANAQSPPKGPSVEELAAEVRQLEDRGAFGIAVQRLNDLRPRLKPDGDFELTLALDEARSGQYDKAWRRLNDSLLAAAIRDTNPQARWHEYGPARWQQWLDGKFDGWHWYVARARAEVGLALGHWNEALEAARIAVGARPITGKEWLVLAVCAGRAGSMAEARDAARQAVLLDPTLPEAWYVHGLLEWHGGKRNEAQELFRTAVRLDSTYRPPALALVRARLPSARPDSIPREILTGAREAAILTSPVRPKIEELHEVDVPAKVTRPIYAALPDSLSGLGKLALPVLVDTRGVIVLHDLPWVDPTRISLSALSQILNSLTLWRFDPAQRHGAPSPTWTSVQIDLPGQ
jgi:tetratricopeptide (TPR) repeat protein